MPDPANPQDLNRYTYVRNNPVRYRDPSGHCPLCIAVGVLILKAIDYGWTAYDAWQAGRTLQGPGASTEEKLTPALTVGLLAWKSLNPMTSCLSDCPWMILFDGAPPASFKGPSRKEASGLVYGTGGVLLGTLSYGLSVISTTRACSRRCGGHGSGGKFLRVCGKKRGWKCTI